jgi:putative membrane protein
MSKPTTAKSGMLFATALLATATALAQAPGGGGQQPGTQGQQPQSPSTPGAGIPDAPSGTAPTAQNYNDQAFVSKALEDGSAEVQLGQLAQEKSQSQDVKQFGQKMVSEHSQMGDKWFKPVAKQLGVAEPKGPSKKDQKMIAKLQALSGSDFDNEYIRMMVKDHKQDLKDFKSEAELAQDPNVKQVAQQGVDIISKHLQLIEQIAQAHNVDVDSKSKEVSSIR